MPKKEKTKVKEKMSKLHGIIIALMSVGIFNSCSNYGLEQARKIKEREIIAADSQEGTSQPTHKQASEKHIAYGAYLAGRVAHLRKNFDAAADYYSQALQSDPQNKELLSRIYVMLTSQGRVKEAAEYAALSQQQGDKNNFTTIIMAISEQKEGKWQTGIQRMNSLQGSVYENFITPLINAWGYAGLGQKDAALEALSKLQKEPAFKALYHFHAGMISDYFNDAPAAREHYEIIINEESTEMSFRALEVISNFYLRQGEKAKAVALTQKYNDDRLMVDMLRQLAERTQKADNKSAPLIKDANIGLSEALFNIAATLRQDNSGTDISHVFICLSIYANPKYDLAKLMLADILESREMYQEANKIYDEILPDSVVYNTIQLKKAGNYMHLEDYKAAELILKTLSDEDSKNTQVLMDLGDVLRISGNNEEAIEYYQQALKRFPANNKNRWLLYYALGMSYEQLDKMDKAEQYLQQALEDSQNHYIVQNYLGYSWLKRGQHMDEAFGLIVDAYEQAPNDGHIADSLGWAMYKFGRYEDAVNFLEKASEIEPANALINEHLGDAYWQLVRKNEARFQWQHTLKMKDDSGEVDKNLIKEKIEKGMSKAQTYTYNETLFYEHLNTLINVEKEEE